MDNRNNTFEDLIVSIVFYNGDNTVLKNINVFSKYNIDVLIINNNSSTEESKSILKQINLYRTVDVINNDKNKGIGYALNQALEGAYKRGKLYLLTMDQDSEISIECISILLNKIRSSNANIISVGPYYLKKEHVDHSVGYLITSGNMIDVNVARRIGGFDSNLFIDCVDFDFSFKVLSYGYSMVQVADAYISHKIGDKKIDSPIGIKYLGHDADRYYYNYRNNIYIYRKYFHVLPGKCIKLFLSLCLKTVKILLIEGDKKRKLQQAYRGIREGTKMEIPLIRRKEY